MKSWNCILLSLATASAPVTAQPAEQGDVPRLTYIERTDAEFRQSDTDRNGQVSRAELEASQQASYLAAARAKNRATFAHLDTDKNGQLSPDEFAKVIPPFKPDVRPMIAQFDTDRNGQISAVEYRAAKVALYDRMDTDKNGIVTAAEMRAAGLLK